ncbi:MAG: SAM-dependent chlorinase/fluorinase [Verrucomicrobiota bacterium]
MPPIITLTTDLGDRDPFAASIKGTLLSECEDCQLVDLSHQIAPHDVKEGALFLLGSIPFFPDDSIHLVNVAPGPPPIVARLANQFIVCPDNGLITLLADHFPIEEIRSILLPEFLEQRTGQKFHGREVFAPAAVSLAKGTPMATLGDLIENPALIDWPHPKLDNPRKLEGLVMHADRFGNLITNFHGETLQELVIERITLGTFSVYGLSRAYTDVPPQHALALIGPSGYLEIAYNGDSAVDRLEASPGLVVSIYPEKPLG